MNRILLFSNEAGLSGDMLVSSLVALGGGEATAERVVQEMSMPVSLVWNKEVPCSLVVEGGERSIELHEMDLALHESNLPGETKLFAMQLFRQRAAALKERKIAYDTAFDITSTLLLCQEMQVSEIIFPSPLVVGSSLAAQKLLPPHLKSDQGSEVEMVTPTAASLLRAISSRVDSSAEKGTNVYGDPKAVSEVQGLFASEGKLPPLRAALFA